MTNELFSAFDNQVRELGCEVAGVAESPETQKPVVILPGGARTITDTATDLGRLLAPQLKIFNRGRTVVIVTQDEDKHPVLIPASPATLSSVFECVAQLNKASRRGDTVEIVPAVCSEQTAKMIQHAEAFIDALPQIRVIARCPVLTHGSDGALQQVFGFDADSGILASGEPIPDMYLDEARNLLSEMISDFRFATQGDRARALAAIITPALVFGGLLEGRAPVDLGESDDSQAGKGYAKKLTAAVYNQTVFSVTQRKGGVGSVEESFNRALISGANFISIDNMRGLIDSPAIESFLTEDSYLARALRTDMRIDPSRVVVQMTSNKAEITKDLMNRSSCVRILKQPVGYQFRKYKEGDILEHVRENQPLYLGAVFGIVQAWWAAEYPRTAETRHDFRVWAQSLDWICQNLLGTCPIMDGHKETQVRITTPELNWLRDITLEVKRQGRTEQWLRTNDLVDIASSGADIDIPGLSAGQTLEAPDARKSVLQAFGRRLKRCFQENESLEIDGKLIARRVVQVERFQSYGGAVDTPEYRFGENSAPDMHLIRTEAAPEETAKRTDAPEGSSISYNNSSMSGIAYINTNEAPSAALGADSDYQKHAVAEEIGTSPTAPPQLSPLTPPMYRWPKSAETKFVDGLLVPSDERHDDALPNKSAGQQLTDQLPEENTDLFIQVEPPVDKDILDQAIINMVDQISLAAEDVGLQMLELCQVRDVCFMITNTRRIIDRPKLLCVPGWLRTGNAEANTLAAELETLLHPDGLRQGEQIRKAS